jgi:hypothetical protein
VYNIPDHPVIRNMENTGFPDGKAAAYPVCPVCGQECEDIYFSNREIVGCDECLKKEDAWEVEDCFPERSYE